MTVTRKYNPGFLTDDELVSSFCVRTSEFESMVEMLRECTGSSNAHQIVIGPRGSGKTSLLLRIAAEVRQDTEMSSRFFPIVFAEESYEVATAGEFWLECLCRLAAQASRRESDPDLQRTVEDLRTHYDDRTLAERCLASLLDFSDREGKRLVLMVENLNMMFKDMADPDAGWRLRHTLQTEPRIVMLTSATSRFEEIDNPKHALYDLFRVRTLRPLDTKECAVLWESVSRRSVGPKTIRSLEILTGGSPRLLTIMARFGAGRSFRDLMADLLDLVDDHTEYFKGHIESLPAQERRVYLALADLWKPATTREVADRCRLETSKCSAQLTRLIERGVVQVEGGTARRKQYYLTERLYNIYYLLRRSRGPDSLIEAIIRFMESYYSSVELKNIVARFIHEAGGSDAKMQSLYPIAIPRLLESPVLGKHRGELLTMELFDRAVTLNNQNRAEDALVLWDELLLRFGQSRNPAVLESVATAVFNKGVTLGGMDRPEDELDAYEEVVRRFGQSENPAVLELVAEALVNKGVTLGGMDRPEDELDAYEEVVRRFGQSENPAVLESVATAVFNKGVTLGGMDRPEDGLDAYEEVVCRFGESKNPAVLEQVAKALFNKGVTLGGMDRPEDELDAYEEVVCRFGESKNPAVLEQVAKALFNKGVTLGGMNRAQDALGALEDAVHRFGQSTDTALLELVANVFVNKGALFVQLNRPQDALTTFDEMLRLFGQNENPEILGWVAQALVVKGTILDEIGRPREALTAFGEAVHRLEKNTAAVSGEWMEVALLRRAGMEFKCLQYEAALDTAGLALELRPESLEIQARCYMIRAKATLAGGNRFACERDIEAVLTLLRKIDSLPPEALDTLMYFSVELGPERMCELIQTSPSANLLLPLTTALERELGLEPRVAREVEEIAQDIRRDLAKLREARTMASSGEEPASPASVQTDRKDD